LPEDPNYDLYQLACKVTARRFFPNFVNLDATFNQHEKWDANDPKRYKYEIATMGCRTRVFEDRFGEKTSIGRGNLSFTTINIVRLAIECMNIRDKEERISTFFRHLDVALDIAARQLCDRFEFQKTALAKQFPLVMSKLWNGSNALKPTDTIEPVINHGTLGVGFIGLAECLVALIGKHHGESEEAQQLGLRIVSHMRSRTNEQLRLKAFQASSQLRTASPSASFPVLPIRFTIPTQTTCRFTITVHRATRLKLKRHTTNSLAVATSSTLRLTAMLLTTPKLSPTSLTSWTNTTSAMVL
jgi:hypothetical protein